MNPVSEYTSLHPDDSHSADFSKTGQDNADSSSSSTCGEEKKGNDRNAKKRYRIHVPDYKRTLVCQSTGQETIISMVQNRFKMSDVNRLKPNLKNMLFMKNKYDCLNVGLPVGFLSTEEVYSCYFKKELVFHPSHYLRQYDVNKYSSNWEMGHFFVSKENLPPAVSPFTKIVDRMQVDFLKNETIFEALVRDERFDEEKIRFCGVKCDGDHLHLSFQADNYQGKLIELYLMKDKDNSLPESIPPRRYPDADVTNVKNEPKAIEQGKGLATAEHSIGAPLDSNTPTGKTCGSSKSPLSRKDLAHLIERVFEIEPRKLTVNDKKKLIKECDLKFRNFALKQANKIYVRHLEDLTKIAKSVGAIFIMDGANCPEVIGTCFRIGTRYIITNNHVMNIIEKKHTAVAEITILIDFNFMEGEAPNPLDRRFKAVPVPVVRHDDLDYAILRMEEPFDELPPCIFSHGISIMDPNQFQWTSMEGQCLTLIGHPYGQPKQTDLLCPVVTEPLDSLEVYGHALRRSPKIEGEAEKECLDSKDPRRGKYHVGNFFHGSSGSPGIVFQNAKKWLMVLHTRGYYLGDPNRSFIEQGILFTEIYKHFQELIHKNVLEVKLEDIFPSVEGDVTIDID